MVNNSSMGYRGELRVIFKNRTSRQLIRIISTFGNALTILLHVLNTKMLIILLCVQDKSLIS